MTVHFIGAGPGAADLITVRGRDLIARCPVCLYAGSLVPKAILDLCPAGARIVDTAPMSLDEIIAECVAATKAGLDVARLHSGDLSVWSALGEQTRRLDALGILYTVTPGVPAFAAAAAALRRELTLPEVAQSVVLTRTPGRASAMPPTETLAAFAATGATLAIHLSIHVLEKSVAELLPFYGADCPAAVVYRAVARGENRPRAPRPARGEGRGCGRNRTHGAYPRRVRRLARRIFAKAPCTMLPISAATGQAGMSGFRFRLADQSSPRGRRRRHRARCRFLRERGRRSTTPPRRQDRPIARRLSHRLPGRVPEHVARYSPREPMRKVRRTARISKQTREPLIIDAPALGVEVEQSLPELGHFGESPRNRNPRDRMLPQIFQHPADEVAHFDQGRFGQFVNALHRGFGGEPVAPAMCSSPQARATSMPRWIE